MSLDTKEVKKIAKLARLEIEPQDVPEYARNLSDILDLVGQLSKADTQGVLAMAHPMNENQRLRSDEITEANNRDLFQEHSPAVENGFFLVPKVIE